VVSFECPIVRRACDVDMTCAGSPTGVVLPKGRNDSLAAPAAIRRGV